MFSVGVSDRPSASGKPQRRRRLARSCPQDDDNHDGDVRFRFDGDLRLTEAHTPNSVLVARATDASGNESAVAQAVRELLREHQVPGSYQVNWDGRDSMGREVASGMYIYRLTTESHVVSGRMTLLR
jgi:hypothetical protein